MDMNHLGKLASLKNLNALPKLKSFKKGSKKESYLRKINRKLKLTAIYISILP
jgi:hypothetical protein